MHRLDPDAVAQPQLSQRFGEVGDCGIDRAADHEIGARRLRRAADDVDHGPLRVLEQRPERARQPHVGVELERKAVFPGRIVELEEIAALGRAGIVDQDVEPAERMVERADGRLTALRRAQVGGADLDSPTARLMDRGGRLLQVACRTRDDQHIAPLLRQTLGAGAPDALAAARDQRDLAIQPQIHHRPPRYTPFAFIAASSASP
jgi:hypothetical protein